MCKLNHIFIFALKIPAHVFTHNYSVLRIFSECDHHITHIPDFLPVAKIACVCGIYPHPPLIG